MTSADILTESPLLNVEGANPRPIGENGKSAIPIQANSVLGRIAQIRAELEGLHERLKTLKGQECEVYSRLVGYYRDIRNWNEGKKAEFAMRVNYKIGGAK
jgi:hypothetical protein